jgi:acyl-CoA synthetase (AMP-forming)/AMP-acid ligase II
MQRELSYGELEKLSLQAAEFLKKSSVGKGDNIAIALPNCFEFIILYFACMQLGAIAVPLNILLGPNEAENIISNSSPKLLIITEEIESKWSDLVSRFDSLKKVILQVSATKKTGEPSKNLFKQIEKINVDDIKSFKSIKDEDVAAIIYTSGTTGQPKGAQIKYYNIIKNGMVFTKRLGINRKSRFLGILSLAHMAGWYNLLIIPFVAESSLILSETFNAETSLSFWDKVIKYKVNTLWLVPTIMSILLSLDRGDKGRKYAKNNIDLVLAGTAPLFLKLKKDFEHKYGVKVNENYGLSETCFAFTNSPKIKYKENSVGKILPGCEAKIIDFDKKSVLASGQEGEIALKTEYLMRGYYRNPEEPLKFTDDGYFLTGDIGFIDRDGYLFITGRKKDLIIRGGINISPREIEELLRKNEHVSDVAVVGIKDDVYGENIAAVIKLIEESRGKISERDIAKYCLDNLAPYKCPNQIYFICEFPRNVAGKIQKIKLKPIIESLTNK